MGRAFGRSPWHLSFRLIRFLERRVSQDGMVGRVCGCLVFVEAAPLARTRTGERDGFYVVSPAIKLIVVAMISVPNA
jgi:hypothetical protein